VEVTVNGVRHSAKHLISTLPSYRLAELVNHQHPRLADELKMIKCVDVAVINLHYKGELLQEQGFGLLIPPIENLPILGIIFDSCCFEMEGQTVLTVMAGGKWFEKWFGTDPKEQDLLKVSTDHVAKILGIHQKPDNFKVNILRNCIPQYVLGHHDRVERIRSYIREKKLPLSVCGASFDGVGVNDVILSAANAVKGLENE
jgi:oxygen-dependent protoporphyrinogen oxidase